MSPRRRPGTAAASEQLRIAPPESLNWVGEEVEVDVVVERRLLGQQQAPDQLAVLGLGNGKSITKSSRRTNASSMFWRKFVARMTAPA
jgi:hypothetical protein